MIARTRLNEVAKARGAAQGIGRVDYGQQFLCAELQCRMCVTMPACGHPCQVAAVTRHPQAFANRIEQCHAAFFVAGVARPVFFRRRALAQIVREGSKADRQRMLLRRRFLIPLTFTLAVLSSGVLAQRATTSAVRTARKGVASKEFKVPAECAERIASSCSARLEIVAGSNRKPIPTSRTASRMPP